MDFNSVGLGSAFYIHTKYEGKEPTLEVGTVKERVLQQPQYQLHTVPGAMNGMGAQQLVRFTVTVNGNDRVIPDLPLNVEIAQKGNVTYSSSPQAMMQVVDAMMQQSKSELEREDYNKMVLSVGEKHMEVLNPRYAEEKKQARTIMSLEERLAATDKKIDSIFTFLQKFDTSSNTKESPIKS